MYNEISKEKIKAYETLHEMEEPVFCESCIHREDILCTDDICFTDDAFKRTYEYVACSKRNRNNNCAFFEEDENYETK